MDDEEKRILSNYRLESADERLHSSKVLLEDGSYKDSIGRSYYAIFTSVRALIALDGKDFSKHSGVISYFQREYIKTGKIDPKYSKYLTKAFQIRNITEYEDFYIASKSDAAEQYEKAMEFCKMIKEHIKNR